MVTAALEYGRGARRPGLILVHWLICWLQIIFKFAARRFRYGVKWYYALLDRDCFRPARGGGQAHSELVAVNISGYGLLPSWCAAGGVDINSARDRARALVA